MHSIWLSSPLPTIEIILLARFAYKTPPESCWTPPIDSNNHAYLVSQYFVPEHSVQTKVFSYCIHTYIKVTHRKTLLNDFDDKCFVSQTCFHYQIEYYCVSLCAQLMIITQNRRKH